MKRLAGLMLSGFLLVPAMARGADFSLYGVRMGATRAELETTWKRLENGDYAIAGTAIFNIKTEFDHMGRLYILGFSVPIGEEFPSGLMATAFQRVIDDMWKTDTSVNVVSRASRGVVEVTVTSRKLQDDYIGHIKAVLSPILKP